MSSITAPAGIKLKDLCERLDVDYDEARYALARGGLTRHIAKRQPGRGNHRVFELDQAFYLAICLKLKAAGVHTPMAARIADWTRKIQQFAQNGNWDYQFAPFLGQLTTEHQWYLDVGDGSIVRIVTDAYPGNEGQLHITPWTDMASKTPCPDAKPSVIFRIDVSRIAEQLQVSPVTSLAEKEKEQSISGTG
jgi:hypothetical protein